MAYPVPPLCLHSFNLHPTIEAATALGQQIVPVVGRLGSFLVAGCKYALSGPAQYISLSDDQKILGLERFRKTLDGFRDYAKQTKQLFPSGGLSPELAKMVRLACRLEQAYADILSPKPSRVIVSKILLGLTFLSAALPFTVSVLQRNNQYLGLLAAGFTRIFLVFLGLMRSPRLNPALVLNQLLNSILTYLVPSVPYALALSAPRLERFSKQFPLPFASIAAVFVGVVYVFANEYKFIFERLRSLCDNHKACISSCLKTKDAEQASTMSESVDWSSLDKQTLDSLIGDLKEITQNPQLQDVPLKMSDGMIFLTAALLKAALDLKLNLDDLNSTSASSSRRTSNSQIDQTNNFDENLKICTRAKWTLAVSAALICFTTVPLFLKEPLGAVDIFMDGAFAIWRMIGIAKDPTAPLEIAVAAFNDLVCLSLLLLPYGGLNKLINFTDTKVGFIVGTTALTVTNLTFSRALATKLANCIVISLTNLPKIQGSIANSAKVFAQSVTQSTVGIQNGIFAIWTARANQGDGVGEASDQETRTLAV